jgi:cytidylate kinase
VGKSTTARMVARELGFTYVDTGALYRTVAWAAREAKVSWDDGEALAKLAAGGEVELLGGATPGVRWDGQDVSLAIRTPEISLGASAVSRHGAVRQALLGLQRRMGHAGGVVLEGRDIGTVVFPDAEVKIFLTADVTVRAQRRHAELEGQGRDRVSLEETLAAVQQRDTQDEGREVAPLKPAEDAAILDTSHLTVTEVVGQVVAMVERVHGTESL